MYVVIYSVLNFCRIQVMKYCIFCDESGTVNEKYIVLGGLILPQKHLRFVESKIKSIKELNLLNNHEIKFSKLNNHKKLRLYRDILDQTYFDISYNINFRCIIFDVEQISHKDYDNSFDNNIHSNTRGFYKQYYSLLHHQFCKVNKDGIFYITLDERSDPSCMYSDLQKFLSVSNGSTRIRHVQGKSSKQSELLQLADLFVGAVSCEINNRARKEKLELINYIKLRKDLDLLSNQRYNNSFKVWRFDYSKSTKSKVNNNILEFLN